MIIEDVLRALGCEIVGPVATVDKALRLAHNGTFDAAILDVTIRGEGLSRGGSSACAWDPVCIASGYGDWALPESLRDRPRLTKPFTEHALREQIQLLCKDATTR